VRRRSGREREDGYGWWAGDAAARAACRGGKAFFGASSCKLEIYGPG